MEEQLISLETAKLAKEKGFDVPVINYYTSINKYNRKNHLSYSEGYQTERLEESNWNNGQGSYPTKAEEVECSAPTQSLLQKWLREEHNLHVLPYISENPNGEIYSFKIYKTIVNNNFVNLDLPFSEQHWQESYEKALEQGLIHALKLI